MTHDMRHTTYNTRYATHDIHDGAHPAHIQNEPYNSQTTYDIAFLVYNSNLCTTTPIILVFSNNFANFIMASQKHAKITEDNQNTSMHPQHSPTYGFFRCRSEGFN